MVQYVKDPLTFEEQLSLLRHRGMHVDDDEEALKCLKCIGYYRLMGYFFPFRKDRSDLFRANASFDKALALYALDSQLRTIVLEGIAHVEIAVRTALTYEVGHAYGAFGHCDAGNVAASSYQHEQWLAEVNKEALRSREAFIVHYKARYDGFPNLPVWMASEVMSLGMLSRWVRLMRRVDQKRIAAHFSIPAPVFSSWLHAMVVVRNICAHHGRLWNRVLGVQPMSPKDRAWSADRNPCATDRVFPLLMVVGTLLDATRADSGDWRGRVNSLLAAFLAAGASASAMGLPERWESHPAWISRAVKQAEPI